jgi:hypothetical protein
MGSIPRRKKVAKRKNKKKKIGEKLLALPPKDNVP